MQSENHNLTVLVTGCSQGVGKALALEYHDQGFIVFATARRIESLSHFKPLLGSGTMHLLALDVSDLDSIRSARDKVAQITGGNLDVLVNNAGQAFGSLAIEIPLQDARNIFEANVFGVMSVVQEFSHLLIASRGGQVVNIGSILGILPMQFCSAYSASKAALHAYSNALRIELKPFNVDVITVIAGGIETNIVADPVRTLPDSLYASIDGKKMWNMRPRFMKAELFAKRLVKRTSCSHPSATHSIGTLASTVWFIVLLIPSALVRYALARIGGFYELKDRLESERKES